MNPCCTAAIARVYEAQNHLEKAAWVYRRLLETDPERQDWRDALERLERSMLNRPRRKPEDLRPLISRWVELAFGFRRILGARKTERLFHSNPPVSKKP